MEHFYDSIGGWFNFADLYDRMVAAAGDGAHFVEVGAWKGRSTAYLAVAIINSGKRIQLDVVDTWLGSGAEHAHDVDLQSGRLYECFLQNLKPVEGRYKPVQSESVAAAQNYADNSLDFVLIDAAHDYDNVSADIQAWLPKIKQGGYLGGDDWAHGDVQRAVKDQLAGTYDIETIGSGWPSWLIKK